MTLLVSDIASEALLQATYNPLLVALACLITIGGSALALHVVTSSTRIQGRPTRQAVLWLSAAAFGLAITTLHYGGMAATRFIGQADTQASPEAMYSAIVVALAVVAVLGLAGCGWLLTRLKVNLTTLKVQGYELAALKEHATQGVVTVLGDGQIQRINRSFENMFECTTEDAAQQPVSTFIPEWPQLVAQTGRHMAVETMGRRKDGGEFPIEVTLTALASGPLACHIGFISDVSDAQSLQQERRHDPHHDFLTGLHNRRFMEEQLEIEFSRSDRSGTPLSLLLLDMDHFKALNETLGQSAGDRVLALVASMLRMYSRKGDILARYGGEEFLLLLPNTDLASAMQVAERIRSETEKLTLSMAGKNIRFTGSLGVTCLQSTFALTPKDLIRNADMALYQAKQRGRNRVEFEIPGRNASDGTAAPCTASKEAPLHA